MRAVLQWLVIALASAPIWATLLIEVWQVFIRPRLIRAAEIDRLADAMCERYGAEAAELSFIHEHAAWCDGEGFEQGIWRRVRKAILQRP